MINRLILHAQGFEMRPNFLIFTMVFAGLFLPGARADASPLEVRISSQSITLGDPLTLSVTIKGSYKDDPEIPDIKDLQISQGGTSSSMNIINGRVSRQMTYSYYISPKKLGRYTIPSFSVTIEGQEVSSQDLTFEVLAPKDHVKSDDDNLPSLFVERTFSNSSPWEGEPIIASTKLFSQVQITGASRTKGKSPDFRVTELEQEEGQAQFGGKAYREITLNDLLIPLKTGKLKVPSDQFRIEYLVRNQATPRRRNPFDLFDGFGRHQSVAKSLGVKQEFLNVKPLPAEGRPKSFSGLTGEFNLSSDLSTKSLSEGETATLTLEVSGYGYLGGMKNPELPITEGFKIYPDKPEVKERVDPKKGLFSKRTIRYALVPLKSGEISLGNLNLSVFNPKKGVYETLSTELGTLSIQFAKEDKAHITAPPEQYQTAPQINKQQVASLGTDLVDIYRKTDSIGIQTIDKSLLQSFLISLLGLVLGSMAAAAWNRNSSRSQTSKLKKISAEAGKKYFRQRKDLFVNQRSSPTDKNHTEALNKMVRTYLGEKFKTQSNSLTLKDVDYIFTKYGLTENTKNNMKDLWKELDLIAYSGKKISSEETQKLAKQADTTIGEIEKQC